MNFTKHLQKQRNTTIFATPGRPWAALSRSWDFPGRSWAALGLSWDTKSLLKCLFFKTCDVQKCGGCFAPTDPVQNIILLFRAAWCRVSVGFVFVAGACFCCRPARSASRTVGRTDRTGRADRTGRTDRTGLRGGLKRIDSDGHVASCRMASCCCWCMLGHLLAHVRSVCLPRLALIFIAGIK